MRIRVYLACIIALSRAASSSAGVYRRPPACLSSVRRVALSVNQRWGSVSAGKSTSCTWTAELATLAWFASDSCSAALGQPATEHSGAQEAYVSRPYMRYNRRFSADIIDAQLISAATIAALLWSLAVGGACHWRCSAHAPETRIC